jgi:hypothetical protein
MGKGTASSNKMMPRMSTYGGQNNPGYHPPTGSSGAKMHGEYSTKGNPLSTPKKGSQIGPGYGNADAMKAQSAIRAQAAKESLRGMPS